ncbi:unnamed protein product [Spirodela intermedia]|uniref:Uncharacterized protein n=1 Tax=Spirodela intermedia TaxID=51605 RepID=A0A7I8JQ58_SPIIN|nr:unnamed protein product [Spirodela intermedia]CAA6671891.1 unnamed protein product [Spirodela intermedia]
MYKSTSFLSHGNHNEHPINHSYKTGPSPSLEMVH